MTVACQRWLFRSSRYRPAGEVIDPTRYGVDLIDERPAKEFVERHHYSGSFPAARCRVGLFRGRELVGVAVFSEPPSSKVMPKWLPHLGHRSQGVELGRFVLLDDVPGNGETWFLARAFREVRTALPDVRALVSFSDPMPRHTDEGRTVMPGHVGTIYQAHGGRHIGRTNPRTLYLDRTGRIVSPRAMSKLRTGDRGAAYAYRQLLAMGAPARRPLESGRDYLRRALAEGPFRKVRHPGNYAYVWAIGDRRERKAFDAVARDALPYPKEIAT